MLLHAGDDLVAANHDGLGPAIRVEVAGRVDHPGEGGGLRDIQLLGRDPEVVKRGGGDAVVPVAEVHLVDVALQELVLAVALLELGRIQHLPELAEDRVLRARVIELGQLLGDRASTLDRAIANVVPRRPRHCREVDAAVLVEVGVLGRQDGVDHMWGEPAEVHRLALLLAEATHHRAVGGHDLAGLGQIVEPADGGSER